MLIFLISIFFLRMYYTLFWYSLLPSLSLCVMQTHQTSSLAPFSSSKMVDKRDRDLREPKFGKLPWEHASRPPWKLASLALKEFPYFFQKEFGISVDSRCIYISLLLSCVITYSSVFLCSDKKSNKAK